ncbi:Monosaccharide-transporting ATPase [Syntrophobotulus glycolicus DSM 8271]|uniref:Monosaccharide-transporting ATPase n=1 Tax=Syntrophobotulus glycolicus (strain DSM 8271 / FlGlyR) TaxID=645991 RepID=F0SVR2_SYNGF|nr:ATP-binding cassette domain-containing protein [Syntrophobotulus glycolicus]ADY55618.1 Monosaccharide-transporting ATPase [Syntrophobotulus glycolicus DSM 8271]
MIRLKDIRFRFEGESQYVLNGLNLEIKKGECLVLAGKSGSGKTTVTRIINGLIPDFYYGELSGEVWIDGKRMRGQELWNQPICGCVFQDPRSQFFTTNTTSEVAFAMENFGFHRNVIRDNLEAAFTDLNMESLKERSLFSLSSGEKQKITVASAYSLHPRILVLDEPGANLDCATTLELARILREMKRKGITIIVSEHRLHYLKDVADRIVVLERGTISAEISANMFLSIPAGFLSSLGLRDIVLRPDKQQPLSNQEPASDESLHVGASELKLDGVYFFYRKNQHVIGGLSFLAHSGEIIGITGTNGTGKTTLIKLISGMLPIRAGRLLLNGKLQNRKDCSRNSHVVLQDVDYQLYTESVEDDIGLGWDDKNKSQKIEDILEALGLTELRARHPGSLSGGQKQRTVIASALVKNKKILILDEPTSGLDYENMRRVSRAIQKKAVAGAIILVVSHDYEFLLNICSRFIKLENGCIVRDEKVINGQELYQCMYGNGNALKKQVSKQPGREPLHPLTKLFAVAAIGISAFIFQSWLSLLLPLMVFTFILASMKEYRVGFGMLAAFTLFSTLNISLTGLFDVQATWGTLFEMIYRMILLVTGAAVFYKSTEITDLIKTLSVLPEEVVLPLAVTLRFIPTIQMEMGSIRDCLNAKGLRYGIISWVASPLQQLEYQLVPLLMRCSTIADELSASCMTRGINSGIKKTSYKSMRLRISDFVMLAATVLLLTAMAWINHFVTWPL